MSGKRPLVPRESTTLNEIDLNRRLENKRQNRILHFETEIPSKTYEQRAPTREEILKAKAKVSLPSLGFMRRK